MEDALLEMDGIIMGVSHFVFERLIYYCYLYYPFVLLHMLWGKNLGRQLDFLGFKL